MKIRLKNRHKVIIMAMLSMVMMTLQLSAQQLVPGELAPKLKAAAWLKGEPITTLEQGRIYVIECWATFCSPCISAMPHLGELQEKFKDQVSIISLNIGEGGTERLKNFMEKHGETMHFAVATDKGISTDKGVSDFEINYMQRTGIAGLPATFVIDQQGKLAFIGGPTELDSVLPQIVSGTWNIETYKTIIMPRLNYFYTNSRFETEEKELIQKGSKKNLYDFYQKRFELFSEKNPDRIREILWWRMADPNGKDLLPEPLRDYGFGIKWMEQLIYYMRSTEVYMTTAWLYQKKGESKKAAELLKDKQNDLAMQQQQLSSSIKTFAPPVKQTLTKPQRTTKKQ